MRRFLSIIIVLGVVLAGGLAAPPKAEAAPPPPAGVVFNNIKGSKAKEYRIITQLNKGINSAPRGSTISMAMYLFNIKSTYTALVSAYRRGVNVQLLIDDGTRTKEIRRLRALMGTYKRPRRPGSFVATCRRGCMSNTPGSVIHAKLYTFSQAGTQKYVSMVSSANPHKVNTVNSWNNIHTINGDKKIYDALRKYFVDMLKDRTNHNYYFTAASGIYKLYFFPRAARTPAQIDILDALNHVSCRGVAKGYGRNGRTVIRIGQWGWTGARFDVARRLWALHDQGCKVDVILNKGRTGPGIFRALLKSSKRYGKIKVYDAWVDRNNNGYASRYIHHKLLMINGNWYGKGNVKVVYTGSQNLTAGGTYINNDIILRIRSNSIYNAYNTNMNYIRDKATKRIFSPPRSRSGAREVDMEKVIERYMDR